MGDDIKAISEWASIFTEPSKLSKTIAKNVALHKKHIDSDIAQIKEYEDAEEMWKAGLVSADLATVAIGPIPPHYPDEEETPLGLPANAIPDWIAGLIYGFTGDN